MVALERPDAAETLLATGPLVGPRRWLRVAPFFAIAAAGMPLALATPSAEPLPVLLAAAVLVASAAAVAVLPWSRWPTGWQAVPALALYPAAGLLQYGAGVYTQFVFLTALPVIWLVLFHGRRLLLLGLALLLVTLACLVLLLPGAYATTDWETVGMAFAVSCLGGLAGHHLVTRARATAIEAAAVARQARRDRDLLNTYLDTASCLLLVLDHTGRVVLLNRFAEQVTGYRADEVIGQTLWHTATEPERVKAAFQDVLTDRRPVQYEGDTVTSTGERRRIAWASSALVDDAGEVTHVVSTGVDLTEQRGAERLFANVLAAATEQMIAATDRQGTFTVFNEGAERLLGYAAEEVIGSHTVELIHLPEELAELAARLGFHSFRELLASPLPSRVNATEEWTLVRKDGGHVPVTMTVSTMLQDGEATGYVLVARDITAEREAAAATFAALEREREAANRLRKLDKIRNDFVASVSHDLRTPLTSVVGSLELLLDGAAGEVDSRQRRLLTVADRNARRLDSLVSDLLLLSRIESGSLRMELADVSLTDVVDGALEALAPQRTADVQIAVAKPTEPVLVRGDPDQLERVAINLVGNALKFTPPTGQVTVQVCADPQDAQLIVSDTGIGVPDEELPHIFDQFFRSSRAQRENRPGTGLGLTIAKSIVEQHSGTIRARNNPAGGTTFAITLPRVVAEAAARAEEP